MPRNNFYIVYFALLVWVNFMYSQEQTNNFNFVNIKEGMSKSPVHSITEDRYGFKWFGTNGAGLIRFDGINYNSYEYNWEDQSSISSDVVYATYIDDANRLWVGTNDGLNLYNRDFDVFERIDLTGVSGIEKNQNVSVHAIIQDKSGNIILGVLNHGVLRINKETLKISKISSEKNIDTGGFSVNSFAINSRGELYVATNLGLKHVNSENDTLEEFVQVYKKDTIKVKTPIESIVIDSDDDIWLGTNSKGVIKISEKNHSINTFDLSDKRVMSIINMGNDEILCGTENDGLIHLSKNGKIIKHYTYNKFDKNSLKSNSIWSLYLDSNERIWLGYYNKGIGVHDRLYSKFQSIESIANNPNSLQASSATDIAKDKSGRLWISMEDGGLDIYVPSTKEFYHVNKHNESYFKGLNSDDIQSVLIDSKENVWLGSWSGGVYLLKKGSNRFINYNTENTKGSLKSNKIMNIAEDTNGLIWFATFRNGLHYYDPEHKTYIHCNMPVFKAYGLHKIDARLVYVDSNNNIWLGTTSGLFKINVSKEGVFSVASMKELMSTQRQNYSGIHQILSITETKNGNILVGTGGGGLFVYNPEANKMEHLNHIKDFKENYISLVIECEDGQIWLGGNSGIISLNLNTHKVKKYTVSDGLLSNDFNNNAVIKDDKGILYFGSYLGVNYFNPKEIPINSSECNLVFTDFKIFNKKVSPEEENSPLSKVISQTENIILTHDQSVFTIEYVGINNTRPEKNQYAYYLEGVDRDWNYVGSTRSATYTNLASGDYVFKVKSANNDGIWNKHPLELKIKVLPPFWLSNIAYLIYTILLLVGLYMFDYFMRKRIKQKQDIQLEREKRLQEERLNQKKLQFFTNISHEFRTPLTLISNPITDIINGMDYNYPIEIQRKHQIIYKNASRLSRLINELMDFRKIESNRMKIQAKEVNIFDQVSNNVEYFEVEAIQRHITLNLENNVDDLKVWLDPSMLEKIMFNLISNAFKVTPDSEMINVEVSKVKENGYKSLLGEGQVKEVVKISVSDTGPGIDQKEYKKIFKRFYQVGQLNKNYYGSTGIGLGLVKNFVELHQGKIEVESVLGQGSKFTIYFPLGKDHFSDNEIFNEMDITPSLEVDTNIQVSNIDDAILDVNNSDVDSQEVSENQDKKHTLLIVEDNSELREYLKNELKSKYRVLTAVDGQKGLEVAKDKTPDIILTDVVMPSIDGVEMCELIKKDLKTSHIPLLMLTAKAMVADRIKGIDSGADAYLSKPFDMDVLKATLNQLLKSRQILFNKHYQGILEPSKSKTTTQDSTFIKKILEYINENISETDLGVELLASELFLSRSQLYRKVKALTGVTVNEFIRKIRLEKAKELLESGDYNISEVTYKVGFSSPSYFTKCFKTYFNIQPSDLKK
ncbi:response regulator [Joostella atrarenae]|uniref:histidine kinase n=1 Tax=Joostella atrarenae TaxID=679257 RepID=A0ABS9J2P6_9FLAO|nr:hybrid sensor histidine kinase/response regulator transcription factor [Joostella atrarenae]MCF8714715.1 response regulator [Joostella atrarenae]